MTEDRQTKINRGKRAKALLGDDLLSEAFLKLEAEYTRAWAGSHHSETAARENYWRAVQILADVRKHLATIVSDGKLAEKELEILGGTNR